MTGHRKTPGLRREEVAQLAAVGLSWYTWLEQARDITPSAQVLESIGRALRLDQTQTDHLFHLAGFGIPDISTSVRSTDGTDFDEIVRSLLPHAAYVLNPHFDVVAFNASAELSAQSATGGSGTAHPAETTPIRVHPVPKLAAQLLLINTDAPESDETILVRGGPWTVRGHGSQKVRYVLCGIAQRRHTSPLSNVLV